MARAGRQAIGPRIGPMLHSVRKSRKLTLEQVAARSGISRSMVSQVERDEVNPTFAVLWSLTQALGVDFSELVGGSASAAQSDSIERVTRAHTPEIRSADGLCLLRILSPPRLAGRTEWYAMEIAEGGRLDSAAHARGAYEHVTVEAGEIEVSSAAATMRLSVGETARYRADVPHAIVNAGAGPARCLLVLLYEHEA